MQEQQRIQQLVPEKNGKYPQPQLPVYAPTFQENKTDEWDLRQFLAVLRRRAVVIGCVALALSGTFWLSTLTREARYEGEFRLLVEPVTVESDLAGLTQTPSTNVYLEQEGMDYDTEMLVLQSPKLLAPVIKQLSTRYPDIRYESLIGNLKIIRFEETKILEVSYQDPDPQKIHFILQELSKAYLKYSLQERQTNLHQGIEFVDSELPQVQVRVNRLQKELQQFRQQSNFMEPEVKTQLLSHEVSTIKLQRLETQKQLAEARALYATLQSPSGRKLAETGTLNTTLPDQSDATQGQNQASVVPGRAGDQLAENLALDATLPDQPDAAQGQNQASVMPGGAGAQLAQTPVSDAISQNQSGAKQAQNEGSLYQQLIAQLRGVESQIATDSTRFREDSPTIQALREKRANLLPVLRREAQRALENKRVEVANQIMMLEVRAAQSAQAETSLTQQINQLPTLARQYTDLQRDLKVATESLNRFLEKRESLQVETAQKEIPWQLLAAPELPQAPISSVMRNLLLGAIAGIVAGIAAALLAERLDNVFHSPNELKEATKLPLLGMIPFRKNLKQLAPVAKAAVEKKPSGYNLVFRNITNSQADSSFPFLEAFRSLHTNIGFLGSDVPIHSLVISSAVQADGKSTVALNLAQAAAAMGQRVLLVDADLRLPKIHTMLDLPNEQGLSNVISTNLPVLDVIQQAPLWDNLFVLTSGQIPPDPIKLLSSKKMHNIMEHLRQEFDLVIYDTPPLLGLADSSLLAPHTAGIVLVVRMGKTDRSVLTQVLEQLKLSRATVLGTVSNGVKKTNNTGYYHNYYYRPRTQSAGAE